MNTGSFQLLIHGYYKKSGRHDLPWRHTTSVYGILVSEIMLQQTQVERVIPKYLSWMKRFPNEKILSLASQSDVLAEWKGLGYPRRARFLHAIAKIAVEKYGGNLPYTMTVEELDELPGIGPYTANAVYVFSQNKRGLCIETNIRTVYIHHFWKDVEGVSDIDILKKIEKTLPDTNFRDWYYALMDYGSYLKRNGIRNNSKSKHYVKQRAFKGSMREVRSAVLDTILSGAKGVSQKKLYDLPFDNTKIDEVVLALEKEGFIKKTPRGSFVICS